MERVCETPAQIASRKNPQAQETAEEAPVRPRIVNTWRQRSNCTNRKKTLDKFDFHRVYLKPEAPLKSVYSLI